MVALSRFRPSFLQKATEDVAPHGATAEASSNEKNPTVTGTDDTATPDIEPAVEQNDKDLVPTENAQRGVQEVEAVTLTWTKPYLILVFILYVHLHATFPSLM